MAGIIFWAAWVAVFNALTIPSVGQLVYSAICDSWCNATSTR